MEQLWEDVDVDLRTTDLENYHAETDALRFDCVCQPIDVDNPDYTNTPYDFVMDTLTNTFYQCMRCGRQYRVKVSVAVEMYTPIAVKYPDARYPSDMGLRDKEE